MLLLKIIIQYQQDTFQLLSLIGPIIGLLGTVIGAIITFFIQKYYYKKQQDDRKQKAILELRKMLSLLASYEYCDLTTKHEYFRKLSNPKKTSEIFKNNIYHDKIIELRPQIVQQISQIEKLYNIDASSVSAIINDKTIIEKSEESLLYIVSLHSVDDILDNGQPINIFELYNNFTDQINKEYDRAYSLLEHIIKNKNK